MNNVGEKSESFATKKQKEVEKNYQAFCREIENHMLTNKSKYALMRGGEVIQFYLKWEDAYATGLKFYEDGLFSIQQATKAPVDLGYFSRALHIR